MLKRILIYQAPWAENDISFESRYHFILRDIKPILKNIYGSDHNIEVLCVMPENLKRKNNNDFPEPYITPVFIAQEEALKIFKSGADYLPMLNDTAPKTKKKRALSFFKRKIGDFEPDMILAINPCTFLKDLYPNALYQFIEAGFFSRPPYPYTQYIDSESTLQDVFPVKYSDQLNELILTHEKTNFINQIRDKYTKLYKEASLIDRSDLDPKNQYKKIILVPLQFNNTFAFDHCCSFSSQEQFLEEVLKNADETTLVVATKHKLTEIDDEYVKNNLRVKYPNLYYIDDTSPFKSKKLNEELSKTMDFLFLSQAILPCVDAVVTVSSSLGLQALLWKIPTICIGNSYIRGFTDYHHIEDIQRLETDNLPYINKDAILYHLFTHYYIPFTYLWKKTNWPYQFFSKRLQVYRDNKCEMLFGSYERIASDEELLETYLDHRNTRFIFQNRPIIEHKNTNKPSNTRLIKDINQEDLTFVVRGPIIWPSDKGYVGGGTKEALASIRHLFPAARIILSTWKNEKVANLDYDTLILSDKPEAYKFLLDKKYNRESNLNRMITSTKEGIMQVNSKYTVLIRTDIKMESKSFLDYWLKFQKRNKDFKVFQERVLTLSHFTRFSKSQDVLYMYHPSDIAMFGLTDDLKKIWDINLVKFKEQFYRILNETDSLSRPELDYYPKYLKKFVKSFNWKPQRIPQYASEQYLWVKCLEKYSRQKPNIQDFYDVIDYQRSDLSIVNNFTVLSNEQFGISMMKESLLHPCHSYHVMTHVDWQKLYQELCDTSFKPDVIDMQRINYMMRFENVYKEQFIKPLNKIKNFKLNIKEKIYSSVQNRKLHKFLRSPAQFIIDMRLFKRAKKLIKTPHKYFSESQHAFLRPLRYLFVQKNIPASAKNNVAPKKLPLHCQFEQFNKYLPLPNTGMEVNPREIYDIASRGLRDYNLREHLADNIAEVVNNKTKSLKLKEFPHKEIYKPYAQTLKNEGWVQLPNILTDQEIADINNYLKGKPIIDFYNTHKVFNLDNIPKETNIGRYTPEFHVNCPHIFKALNHPAVLSVAEQYLGAKPTLSVVMLMWSFLNNNPARNMQKFHRDNDDYRFCKVFILLNDIDGLEDGPHLYIKNTHDQQEVWNRINQMNISEKQKLEKMEHIFAGWPRNRYPDELVEELFPQNDFKYHMGKKGTTVMENTWGIHRGIPPKRKHRLILQAQYSLQPTPMFSYTPIPVSGKQKTPKDIQYVNRMYCDYV